MSTRTPTPLLARFVKNERRPEWLLAPSIPTCASVRFVDRGSVKNFGVSACAIYNLGRPRLPEFEMKVTIRGEITTDWNDVQLVLAR
jgi:hypothetical protein